MRDVRGIGRLWGMLGASQAGFEGSELTPDGGCTIQPSSAVAVVESISVSVGRAKSHHPPHLPVLSVPLQTLGPHPVRFFLTATCPVNLASLLHIPPYSQRQAIVRVHFSAV